MPSKRTLRLIEIQGSVLPEDEWIIGTSDLSYFNGVGFSMPLASGKMLGLSRDTAIESCGHEDSIEPTSNLDDPIMVTPIESGPHDEMLPLSYKHREEAIQASSDDEAIGSSIESLSGNILLSQIERDVDSNPNLYAFVPGIFYCSNQQTSVDAVLIEVTQKSHFGITLPSFKPEDVHSFDVSNALVLRDSKSTHEVDVSEEILGQFTVESFLQDSGLSKDAPSYNSNVEIGIALAKQVQLSQLKQAYIATEHMEERISRFLDDIEFFGLSPRNRIYVKNRKHPYGTIVDVEYLGLECILELHGRTGIACPDEIDMEIELGNLSFSKTAGSLSEVDIEHAILDMLDFINSELGTEASKSDVLTALFKEGSI